MAVRVTPTPPMLPQVVTSVRTEPVEPPSAPVEPTSVKPAPVEPTSEAPATRPLGVMEAGSPAKRAYGSRPSLARLLLCLLRRFLAPPFVEIVLAERMSTSEVGEHLASLFADRGGAMEAFEFYRAALAPSIKLADAFRIRSVPSLRPDHRRSYVEDRLDCGRHKRPVHSSCARPGRAPRSARVDLSGEPYVRRGDGLAREGRC
jgi:hypothetical protein